MTKYVIKRLLLILPLILCVAIAIFTLMYFVPGDPARIMAGNDASEAQIQELRVKLDLDKPYGVRLGKYLANVFFRFDLGNSLSNGSSISTAIRERFPRTLLLTVGSLAVTMLVGIPLGIASAVNRGTWRDKLAIFFSLVAVSVPAFWLALMLVIVFALNLKWLPPLGMGGPEYWVLPILANSVMGIAMQARQTRSSMLESMNSDYITTCWAKGLSQRGIILHHALPNACIPIITESFFTVSAGVAGALIIENVFSIPGIGSYLISAVNTRDYTAVQSTVVFIAIMTSALNLITDLMYAFVDPRIKAAFAGGGKRARKKAGPAA